ncbi:hypothetical protein ACN4EK_07065 [Pantanalinema rosaneae CENA516]|uniref:hypothetical protein n=1 Tax=Pantanalinema rosaneae TaxID=1620701 RepID=UPI003D6E1F10
MTGQMCWLRKFGTNGALILHLRLESHQPWRPYTHFAGIAVPDYPIPNGSKGWATYQKLFNAGWILIPTSQGATESNNPSLAA